MQGLYRLYLLRKLTMSDNEITRLSNDLGLLTNLQELDISRNGLYDRLIVRTCYCPPVDAGETLLLDELWKSSKIED